MSQLTNKITAFLKKDSATGILLIIATIAALIIANTPLNSYYQHLMHLKFTVGFEKLNISFSLAHWINDGLMALFFLLVGLEIKSELKFGRLQSFQSAVFPVVAAICGVVFPALIFYWLNKGTPYIHGWAIPMATDIAFVVGIIAILGSRVPAWIKVFVTTIAVVDDLIAVLVIAFFYTEEIYWIPLGIAAVCTLILLYFNYKRINRLTPYLVVGFFLWWAVLASGVHATIAGVILAFTIPLRKEWEVEKVKAFAERGFNMFKKAKEDTFSYSTKDAYYYLEKTQREMESPLKRLERKLHGPVYLIIMPLFAFVNAGIVFNSEILSEVFHLPITWGIILGLTIGKPLGVLFAAWVLVTFFFKDMPKTKAIWKALFGISLLCGIGFTMSLFISNLSFSNPTIIEDAKIGVLIASLISGVFGYIFLKQATKNPDEVQLDKLQ